MGENISEIEFAVFDLETTGLAPELGDRIIEIAAVRLRNGRQAGSFHSLVNPGDKAVSPGAFAVNQISRQMLEDAPDSSQVLPKFLDFISGSCLAAYNAPFDSSFLSSELRLLKRELAPEMQIADILTMARRLLPGLERYPLWFVAKALGIKTIQEHRALSDVLITVEVFKRLNSVLIKKGIVDFEQFISLFGLSSPMSDNINSAKIARIQKALDLGASLKIRYFTRHSAEFSQREVIPKAIIQEKNQLYLVGFCNLRKQERTFRIDNILDLEMGTLLRSAQEPSPAGRKNRP
jgi:DNA polymerase III epsilon subunit family exonuclease